MAALKLLVVMAAVTFLLGLVAQVVLARAAGRRRLHAQPAGDPLDGVRYAFTGALSPRAKESARQHPIAWALGVGYHLGTFTALATLALAVLEWAPAGALLVALAAVLALGTASGVALLGKRILEPSLRALSHPDDFVANVLVTSLGGLSLGWVLTGAGAPILLVVGASLLFYAPLGKLRHAAFFFVSRWHLGAFFGRRGVFPPHSR
jgi:hypothetical protein